MARQRPLPKRPTRSRLQTCISGEVHEMVDLYCARYGLTEAKFFELAALEKTSGIGDAKAVVKQLKSVNEQLHILSEHAHVFVQMWLCNTQLFSQEEQERSRPKVSAVHQRFMQQIRTNLTGGKGFLADYQRNLRPAPTQPTEAASSNRAQLQNPSVGTR